MSISKIGYFLLVPMVAAASLSDRARQLMGGAEEIVFIERSVYKDGHYYRNFGCDAMDPNDWYHAPDGSRICKLNLRTRQLTVIKEAAKGDFRDIRVSYDGAKLLFAWRVGGTHNYNLYEMASDGSNIRQLTSGSNWDDFGPEYLPDGGIIFCSSRGKRFIPCNHCQGAQLFRMDADGSNLLMLSANNVRDDRPAIMPDGQILYSRWEYVDANILHYLDVWTMNPDGTSQFLAFGGTVRAELEARQLYWAKFDFMPIPGAKGKIVAVYDPPHGIRENAGNVVVIDLTKGPDAYWNVKQISPKRNLVYDYQTGQMPWCYRWDVGFRDPYPLSADCFFVAEGTNVFLLDDKANLEKVCSGTKMVHDPRPLMPRHREPVIPSKIDLSKATGTFFVSDIYKGRGREMEGVKRGDIKKLLILEDLPKPISFYSLSSLLSMDGSHTLRRVLGTVPVEEDGSVAFEAPAIRGLYFVALDKNDLAVKRMQSYTMVMPGEVQGCIGCHDVKIAANTYADNRSALAAMKRKPSVIEPPPAGIPRVFDYERDIQPILDRHCVVCHNPDKPSGHVMLTGHRTEWFSQSYYTLYANNQVSAMSDRYQYEHREHRPYGFGTGASALLKKIDGHHHHVSFTPIERDTVRLWIETSATYGGTYAIFNTEESAVAGALANNPRVRIQGPLENTIATRCLTCHDSEANLGRRPHRARQNSPKHCWNLYDLSAPEQSLILKAPLAREAGGYGWCTNVYGAAGAFASTNEWHYQQILGEIRKAAARQAGNRHLRPELPGFTPNLYYVHWMQRWGILPPSFDRKKDKIDCRKTDEAYWESLGYDPSKPLPSALGKEQANKGE